MSLRFQFRVVMSATNSRKKMLGLSVHVHQFALYGVHVVFMLFRFIYVHWTPT